VGNLTPEKSDRAELGHPRKVLCEQLRVDVPLLADHFLGFIHHEHREENVVVKAVVLREMVVKSEPFGREVDVFEPADEADVLFVELWG
jgi:hypothetical protein